MTARARCRLLRGEDAAELRQNPGRANRIVKELFAEVPLRLGRFEKRVRASVRKARLRQVGIVRRHHQPLNAANLLIDEAAQLRRTVALGSDDGAERQRENGCCGPPQPPGMITWSM